MFYIEEIEGMPETTTGKWYSVIDNMTSYRWDGGRAWKVEGFNHVLANDESQERIKQAMEEYNG